MILRMAAVPYGIVVRVRNLCYDSGRAQIHRADVPVICVGNLTLGGTGKTPMVAWLCRWLRGHHVRVAIVSRGYGSRDGAHNDEALELHQQLPDVPHLQNPDRVAAVSVAQEELAAQVIVLDDGFQHRRLHRDIDIVLIDATEPFGHGFLFPRGTLREPLGSLRRADVIVLSRADHVGEARRQAIRSRIRKLNREAIWVETSHQPNGLLNSGNELRPMRDLRGEPVATFCGVGNPDAFSQTVRTCGCRVVATRVFPDHHPFSNDDIESLSRWAHALEVAAVLCTQKDLVKIGLDQLGGKPLWAVTIEMKPSTSMTQFEQLLESSAVKDIRLASQVPTAASNDGGIVSQH